VRGARRRPIPPRLSRGEFCGVWVSVIVSF
jgi:hypothetical protein